MTHPLTYYLYYALLLVFGTYLSLAFSGVRRTLKNILLGIAIIAFCGVLQIIGLSLWGENMLWRIYPLICHLPIALALRFIWGKRLLTIVASITTAYLYCQPSKWLGLMVAAVTENQLTGDLIRIFGLLLTGSACFWYLSSVTAELFNKKNTSVLLVAGVPIFYYIFCYSVRIYSTFWLNHIELVSEFLLFLVSTLELLFCTIYYKLDLQKMHAQRKAEIIRIAAEQQEKELEAIRRSEQEIRLLRHDMRLFLSEVAICLDSADYDGARKIIDGVRTNVDATTVSRYCNIPTVNYILSDYAERCSRAKVTFTPTLDLQVLPLDEILFASILSNALDNAFDAQADVSVEERCIEMMLSYVNGKILLSVENTFGKPPVFKDGMPTSSRGEGHGYGTQSIRYVTERLGGNCQFTVQGNRFLFRAVI